MRSVAQNLIAPQAVAIAPQAMAIARQAVANVSSEGIAEERSFLAADVLRGSGRLQLQVRGESMLPTLWPQDVVEITRCSVEDVQPGEIVLALREGRLFLHRFVARCEPAGFILLGDSMPAADPEFPEEALLGRFSGRITGWVEHGTIGKMAAEQGAQHTGFGERSYSSAGPVLPLTIWRWALGRLLCYCGPARRLSLRLHRRFHKAQAGRTASPRAMIDLRIS